MTGVGVERGRDRIERIWGRKIEEDGLKFLVDFIDIIDINFNHKHLKLVNLNLNSYDL